MRVDAFDFDLPSELIAQDPPPERGGSRLLVVSGDADEVSHAVFNELPEHLRRGDLLVVNDTRVFPARLLGRRLPGGGAVECLLIERMSGASDDRATGEYQALMHPGQRLKAGSRVCFERDGTAIDGEVRARHFNGRRTVRLWTRDGSDLTAAIDRIGHIPLPPYIRRDDSADDRERYQTVYARQRGSIAAPTAGLHFSQAMIERLARAGVDVASVTLHVGYGTFKPVRTEAVEDHMVDPEAFVVSEATAGALSMARQNGRRVIAVGTTTVRALESLTITATGIIEPAAGSTDLFIRPGHQFRIVNGLITNFHLPRSSLLMLVSAFGGHDRIMAAYREAVARRYRFYSYGDAMLILRT
jgi:S-adenosylmethionine:tRNA ribosyltransferase-isomerase